MCKSLTHPSQSIKLVTVEYNVRLAGCRTQGLSLSELLTRHRFSSVENPYLNVWSYVGNLFVCQGPDLVYLACSWCFPFPGLHKNHAATGCEPALAGSRFS